MAVANRGRRHWRADRRRPTRVLRVARQRAARPRSPFRLPAMEACPARSPDARSRGCRRPAADQRARAEGRGLCDEGRHVQPGRSLRLANLPRRPSSPTRAGCRNWCWCRAMWHRALASSPYGATSSPPMNTPLPVLPGVITIAKPGTPGDPFVDAFRGVHTACADGTSPAHAAPPSLTPAATSTPVSATRPQWAGRSDRLSSDAVCVMRAGVRRGKSAIQRHVSAHGGQSDVLEHQARAGATRRSAAETPRARPAARRRSVRLPTTPARTPARPATTIPNTTRKMPLKLAELGAAEAGDLARRIPERRMSSPPSRSAAAGKPG